MRDERIEGRIGPARKMVIKNGYRQGIGSLAQVGSRSTGGRWWRHEDSRACARGNGGEADAPLAPCEMDRDQCRADRLHRLAIRGIPDPALHRRRHGRDARCARHMDCRQAPGAAYSKSGGAGRSEITSGIHPSRFNTCSTRAPPSTTRTESRPGIPRCGVTPHHRCRMHRGHRRSQARGRRRAGNSQYPRHLLQVIKRGRTADRNRSPRRWPDSLAPAVIHRQDRCRRCRCDRRFRSPPTPGLAW